MFFGLLLFMAGTLTRRRRPALSLHYKGSGAQLRLSEDLRYSAQMLKPPLRLLLPPRAFPLLSQQPRLGSPQQALKIEILAQQLQVVIIAPPARSTAGDRLATARAL